MHGHKFKEIIIVYSIKFNINNTIITRIIITMLVELILQRLKNSVRYVKKIRNNFAKKVNAMF